DGEDEGGVRPPDEALLRPVAESWSAEDQASQRAPRQLAVTPALRANGLGKDLVELPARRLGACAGRGTELVAKARAEFDAPVDAGRRGEPQKLGQRRQWPPEPSGAARAREQRLFLVTRKAPPFPVPVRPQLEHRRVAVAILLDASADLRPHAVAAQVNGN